MNTTEKPKGKPGPKFLFGQERMRNRSFKTTDDQWAKFLRLGGSGWLRKMIDKAKEPAALESKL